MSDVLIWAIGLGIGGVAILAGYYGIPYLKRWAAWKQVRPYVIAAIMEAYKASDKAVEFGMERLEGVKKKALADYLYNFIPESVSVGPLTINPRDVISEAQWREWVQEVYDELLGLLDEARDDLHTEFQEWLGTV